MSCETVQESLTTSFLDRTPATPDDAAHAQGCEACGRLVLELRAVQGHLAAVQVPPLRPSARVACEARAVRALRARRAARAPAPLRGLGGDLMHALLIGLLALPVAAGHAWLVTWVGQHLLAPWLPASILDWLAVVYFAPVALALAVLYGALPLAVMAGRRELLEES